MSAKKILIVDDEKDMLEMLGYILKDQGYEVIRTANGKDAIELAKTKNPNLILLDINMPGIDGAQVGEALRDDPATRNIPVIYQTALVKKEEVSDGYVQGSKVGNMQFIGKPYDRDELLRIVKRTIGTA